MFKHSGSTMNKDMFRVSFNTGFIPADNLICCDRELVSPEDAHKDFERLPADFNIYFSFKDYCEGIEGALPCRSDKTELNDLCSNCAKLMSKEVQHWKEAKEIINKHTRLSIEQARQLIPNQEEFLAEGAKKKLKWKPEQYKIEASMFEREQDGSQTQEESKTGAEQRSRIQTIIESHIDMNEEQIPLGDNDENQDKRESLTNTQKSSASFFSRATSFGNSTVALAEKEMAQQQKQLRESNRTLMLKYEELSKKEQDDATKDELLVIR